MTSLDRPDVALASSWAETIAEFHAAGEQHVHGAGLWEFDTVDVTAAGCRAVVEHLVAQADPATPLADNRVHCSYFWITDGDGADREVIGFLAVRHTLNAWLLEEGGHIGYAVRPSRRREGHATRALELGVAESARLGIDRVLVTCDDDNVGSRLTIERGGGVYEDSRNGKLRFWIDADRSAG
ncbi:GNAT family N-acetyltransferase [Nocardioides sp. YIM 152315]|uniref:GNAT family N-acetyltransferase n=1 Tax=Nocardioides sp. YIM 152315 TaxID=3031760 RepID=UPI0023DC120E|nr:GNAT family N-acetyltransferase [Nocardioides sp. YIM 152315]MDF1605032.1 GNAT family N-acetyltransferase [Nocardioides sp. YIM 152315]